MIALGQCVPGTVVWYAPTMDGGVRFRGLIGAAAPVLSGATWVVPLVEMAHAYAEWRGNPQRTYVYAAALDNLFIDAGTAGPGEGRTP